jgi:ABC-2 type transport system permease protein
MSDTSRIRRLVLSEWTKLRSVPSTPWLLLAAASTTITLSVLVCSALDTAGGAPGCAPGRPGCGDEDPVLNSLSGIYIGQLAFVVLGVLMATSEHATGTIRMTFAAIPRRSRVLLGKCAVLSATAVVAGLATSMGAFLLGQPILHSNGFVPDQGYPLVSLTDPTAARAVVGSALYLGTIALLGFAAGTITRHAGSAVAAVVAAVYLPAIISLALAEPIRDRVQQVSPMMAGLAVQRTVPRADSVPIGTWAGLGVAAAWSVAALVIAAQLDRRRDP